MKCRYIVKEVEQVIRDIGRSLAALSLANTEVLSRISDQVNRLQSEMQRAEFEASQSQLDIVDKLNHGIKEQKLDQAFANDMLEEIARAVGVPVEPSEIKLLTLLGSNLEFGMCFTTWFKPAQALIEDQHIANAALHHGL
ncbi:hypothetical protein KIW84_063271 [Lathyrus oleraceus]|uniref:Uncharacterized protein n=1 Tax=Pisum sativum TaxID=3888 RepID=A0A9D4W8I0_PEA|nr:hypothetical protein KIW84_063271 [Pisum sativum]